MADFSLLIIEWYRLNHRDLPWRNTTNPYFIWLSEVILQQTRIDQGINYYLRFISKYPTINELANADEQEILNDWQGLGYYSRARNLHYSAKQVSKELNGVFPNTYQEILKLKGVGKYTAAAIASFAFKEPKAVVDGNVYRVLSRHFDIETPIDSTEGVKLFQGLADELISKNRPDEHNQAIMEIGAVICTPKPKCESCPIQMSCVAFEKKNFSERPVKSKRTKVRNRYFHFFVCSDNGQTLIEKRTSKDIWQNMFQFPLRETSDEYVDIPENWTKFKVRESAEIIHILSHQKIHAKFHHFSVLLPDLNEDTLIVEWDKIQDYPLPRLVDRYLDEEDFT